MCKIVNLSIQYSVLSLSFYNINQPFNLLNIGKKYMKYLQNKRMDDVSAYGGNAKILQDPTDEKLGFVADLDCNKAYGWFEDSIDRKEPIERVYPIIDVSATEQAVLRRTRPETNKGFGFGHSTSSGTQGNTTFTSTQ